MEPDEPLTVTCTLAQANYTVVVPPEFNDFKAEVQRVIGIDEDFVLEVEKEDGTFETLFSVSSLTEESVVRVKPIVKWFLLRQQALSCLEATKDIIAALHKQVTLSLRLVHSYPERKKTSRYKTPYQTQLLTNRSRLKKLKKDTGNLSQR